MIIGAGVALTVITAYIIYLASPPCKRCSKIEPEQPVIL